MRILQRILLLVLCVASPLLAHADERITRYNVRLTVQSSGDLLVHEQITVRAEGREIKRGIYRDLVALVPGGYGLLLAPVEIISITRDGQSEPYHTKKQATGLRIYMGQEGKYLRHGIHTYGITYRMGWQVRQFANRDELYWNITGNEWNFPIDMAEAQIILPDGAGIIQRAAYAGARGEKGTEGRDYALEQVGESTLAVQSTRPFAVGEGLTVAVAWPKGFVPAHDHAAWSRLLWQANPVILIGLVGLFGLSLYFFLAWAAVGRDPQRGPVIPIYSPRHSPVLLRYVRKMRFDQTALVAGIVALAVKGYLKIEERLHYTTEAKTGIMAVLAAHAPRDFVLVQQEGGRDADAVELELNQLLFSGERDEVALTRTNRSQVVGIVRGFKRFLDYRFSKQNFMHNGLAYAVGLLLTLLMWWGLTFQQGGEALAVGAFMSIWLGIWSIGTGVLVVHAVQSWRAVFTGSTWNMFPAIFVTAFALPFIGFWCMGVFMTVHATGFAATAFLVMAALLNVSFFFLLKAPTAQGRVLLDEADGVKLYLTVSEADRLKFFTPPDTPEAFERFLPYAIALDVHTQWAERFKAVLASQQQAPGGINLRQTNNFGSWYGSSQPMSASMAGALAGALGASLTAATASNSSGSGGGGSSGGGSGGGGGGGW